MSKNYYNVDETLAIAEKIEANGANFYRKAAENSKDEDAKDMLASLADMEDEHRNAFAVMRAQFVQSGAFDPQGQMATFLNAVADNYVFDLKTDPSKKLTGDEKLEDILRFAIGLEKDSVVFYSGIREAASDPADREKIAKIIKQELGHIVTLGRALEKLGV